MTQDEIIDMARQAGMEVHSSKGQIRIGSAVFTGDDTTNQVVAFAKLVADKEREACAKVCEQSAQNYYPAMMEAITAIKEALAQPEQTEVQQLIALVRAQQITIDKLEAALEQPVVEKPQPEPPSDENITDAWVSASDSDGIAYDGPSFERGYRLGRGDYDEYTGALVADAIKQAQPASVQEPMHPEIKKLYEDFFDKHFAETQRTEPVIDHFANAGKVMNSQPVAWMHSRTKLFYYLSVDPEKSGLLDEPTDEALLVYTTPPQRTWVGLTDDEIEAADYITMTQEDYEVYSINQDSVMDFARTIEAKLKDKNHD